jgi:hypothetical protein
MIRAGARQQLRELVARQHPRSRNLARLGTSAEVALQLSAVTGHETWPT